MEPTTSPNSYCNNPLNNTSALLIYRRSDYVTLLDIIITSECNLSLGLRVSTHLVTTTILYPLTLPSYPLACLEPPGLKVLTYYPLIQGNPMEIQVSLCENKNNILIMYLSHSAKIIRTSHIHKRKAMVCWF